MLDPLDRHSRDSTLFQFTTKRLRDFIDPNHLLIQLDEQFDFPKLVEPLEDYYCRDNGRPAIHPEVLVRALLISSLLSIKRHTLEPGQATKVESNMYGRHSQGGMLDSYQ